LFVYFSKFAPTLKLITMKKIVFSLLFFALSFHFVQAKEYKVLSPGGKIVFKINVAQNITYSIETAGGKVLLAPSEISMTLDNGMNFSKNAKVRKAKRKKYDKVEHAVVPRKYKNIRVNYNELKLTFKGKYMLTIRVFDDGAAYRWETNMDGEITVKSEKAQFSFDKDYKIWFPEINTFFSHEEEEYKILKLSNISDKRFAYKGVLVDLGENYKVLLTEADLEDYPGIFYRGLGKDKTGFTGIFPEYPLKTKQKNDRDVEVVRTTGYLAKTNGKRTFPWRVFVITDNDAQLVESELVWKLAPALKLNNTNWIKPGLVAWDWWNALNIYGVDFHSGVNTPTYKYFIDFAHDFNIPYIILDEGWYELDDVLKIKKQVNLPELLNYAAGKNVGIILWVTWKALDDKLDEALETFEKWGVKGIKVDFMQREDQWMVNYYWRVADKAAKHHLLVDFHGAYQPTGLRRAYPNVITREAVAGLEQDKWGEKANPKHDVTIPFTRMVCGPMDYTPGAMLNANRKNFRTVFEEPMSMGTRCHQLAMYVVFESPLQMLADNPSNYRKEKEAMDFLSQVPTVWDDTKVLDAKVGEYIVIARKKDNKWYIGAMTNWKKRDIKINFDFLDDKGYYLDSWQDGINADRHAADFKTGKSRINKNTTLRIHLAPGGGWTGIISEMENSTKNQ